MKKKFINGILMAALLFAATSSFVSCKDNIDDELPPIYNALAQKSSDLQAKIDSLKKVIDDLEVKQEYYNYYFDTTINNYFTNIDTTIIKQINQIYQIDSSLTVVNETINNIVNNYNDVTQEIYNITYNIDSITNVLNIYETNITDLSDDVSTLWEKVNELYQKVEDMLNGTMITDITINATRNDIFGILNMPGINIPALAAYYGTNDAGIEEFPVAGVDFNVGGGRLACFLEENELPYDGFVNFGSSDYITNPYGNAGQIFFTVNSNDFQNFDISKFAKIQIENSVGEVAPITLGNVRRSGARITWALGKKFYQETGKVTDNGFYTAEATIAEGDLDPTKFQIEKFIDLKKLQSEIKSRIKDIRDVEGEYSNPADTYRGPKAVFKNFVREIAGLVFGLFKNDLTETDYKTNASYSPQRLAFYVEKDGKYVRKGQTGDINLLVTAVKPLSYNTFYEYEKSKEDNWAIEDVLERAISRIAREIKERWGDMGVSAKIVSINDSEESVTIKLNSKTETIKVSNAGYMTDLKKAIEVNGGLDAVNDKLAKLLKTYTLGQAAESAAERINTYLDKASDYLTNLINKHLFTRAVAPIIIFETNNGMDRLCQGMFINRGTMHAYLTSGTMELLAPAYKKYVALKKSGQLLQAEVLPGNTQEYEFDLNEKGDYTIILSCVDYFGYVITKKYDVHVK